MATYGSLLIDAGGGVIDHSKQSDLQPGATVILGLGGTGSDAVIKLKREVYKQLKPNDVNAVIPKYNDIRYLLVDSDASKVKAGNGKISDIDESTEYFSIANKSIKAVFAATEVLKGRRNLDWLDYEHISIDDASTGAGGIRQVGRFLLVDQAEKLYAKFKATFQDALTGADGKLTVHICAGISGGTGSGIFLDVCYLVRQVLAEIGKPESSVCGYFFLPDVNLSVPGISANPLISNYVAVNGFAALQELDYCMNFNRNQDCFEMNYGFKTIRNKEKPVDLCYLISTTDEQGKMISDGYNYAMGVVTDFIINFMARVNVPDDMGKDAAEGITLEGHIANLNNIKAGIRLQHGANVEYNILGASMAEMPLSEIATYLGYRLFACYAQLGDKVPTEKERDDFLQMIQMKYDDIKQALTRGCRQKLDFPTRYNAALFRAHGNGQFVDFADEFLAHNKGELDKNSRTFRETIKDYTIPDNSTSLIGRTYKELCEKYVTDMEYGPFYAQRMLCGSQNQNLIHAVDGFITQNQTSYEAEIRQSQRRMQEYDDALAKMENANFLNANGRMENYMNALENLYVHHYKVEMLQTMNIILQDYKQQLIKLNNNFFSLLTNVFDTLQKTFEVNGEVLTHSAKMGNNYNWKILSVLDIRNGLDDEVRKLDLQQTLYEMMSSLLSNCARWMRDEEHEIPKLISDFILKAFRSATQKTITDYLKEKYQVDNTVLLAQKIEDDILRDKLFVDSTPLFWKNPMYHNPVGGNSTLTVPYDSAEIKAAAHSYAGKHREYAVRESGITDKIFMMRFYSGLPMYAYQGILELQDKYERDNTPGRHLRERGTGRYNWNEWLPSPIPASFKVGIPIDRIEEKNKELINEFEKAEEAGIVVRDSLWNWDLMITGELDLQAIIAEYGFETDGRVDANKLTALIGRLEEEVKTRRAGAEKLRIAYPKTDDGIQRQVMLDFYLEAPVISQRLHEEMEKYRDIVAKINQLTEYKTRYLEEAAERKDFFNAVFTGVLFYGNTITFTYEEYGIEKKIELQNYEMPLGDTGAYQAFMNYHTLDGGIKDRIVDEVRRRMNEENCREVRESVKMLDARMAIRIAQYEMRHDVTDLIHDDLEKFYEEFMKAFYAFKLTIPIS